MCTPLVENQQTFAENRVAEIKRASDITFRYIPSDQNPADLPTRGLPANELSDSTLWWHGLEKPEIFWPEWCSPEITPEVLKETQTDAPTVFYEVAALAMIKIKDLLFVRLMKRDIRG